MLLFSATPGACAPTCAAGRNRSGRTARIEARMLPPGVVEGDVHDTLSTYRPEELRHGEEAEQAPLRSGERRRPRSRAPLAPPAPGARHHAGRLRGARRLPPPAPLPPRAHAPGASRFLPLRDALLRPAQHP